MRGLFFSGFSCCVRWNAERLFWRWIRACRSFSFHGRGQAPPWRVRPRLNRPLRCLNRHSQDPLSNRPFLFLTQASGELSVRKELLPRFSPRSRQRRIRGKLLPRPFRRNNCNTACNNALTPLKHKNVSVLPRVPITTYRPCLRQTRCRRWTFRKMTAR